MRDGVIWKFHLDPDRTGRCTVAMPRIRAAYLDPRVPVEGRHFFVLGTGWTVPPEAVYHRSAVQMANGLVWHIMEAA